jgi:hypothetical protein
MCLLLHVFDFLGEAFHFSRNLFGRAFGRFIIKLLSFASHKPLGLQPLLPMKWGIFLLTQNIKNPKGDLAQFLYDSK